MQTKKGPANRFFSTQGPAPSSALPGRGIAPRFRSVPPSADSRSLPPLPVCVPGLLWLPALLWRGGIPAGACPSSALPGRG